MKCLKQQQILRRSQDGDSEYVKCINKASKNFGKEVTEPDCLECPLKQLGPCRQDCHVRRREGMEYPEPKVVGGLLLFEKDQGNLDGFTKVADNQYKSDWPDCPMLLTNNSINPDGSLKIVCCCGKDLNERTHAECSKCFSELKIIPEKLLPPPLFNQVKNYSKAVYKWVASGLESRTDEEVEKIFQEYCSTCEKYDKDKQVCLHCGCKIQTGGIAISNKLKMASEHCPLGKW